MGAPVAIEKTISSNRPTDSLLGRRVTDLWDDGEVWGFSLGGAAIAIYGPSKILGPAATIGVSSQLDARQLLGLGEADDQVRLRFEGGLTIQVDRRETLKQGTRALLAIMENGETCVW